MAYGRLTYGDQLFIHDNYILSGVQSVNINVPFDQVPINVLGIGNYQNEINTLPLINVSLERFLITNDPIYDYYQSGIESTSHYVFANELETRKYGKINNSFVSSYRLSTSVGQPVTITNDLIGYGGLETGFYSTGIEYTFETGNPELDLKITSAQTTNVFLSKPYFERITSLSYETSANVEPLYAIGYKNPVKYFKNYPLEEKISLTVEIENDNLKSIADTLCSELYQEDITIVVEEKCTESGFVFSGYFPKCSLTNQSYEGRVGNNVVFNLDYTYYRNKEEDQNYLNSAPSLIITGYYAPPEPSTGVQAPDVVCYQIE